MSRKTDLPKQLNFPRTPNVFHQQDEQGDFVSQLCTSLQEMEGNLNDDMDKFKGVLMDLVRAAGAQIRPMVKPEAVLQLQDAIDDLKRRTVPAASIMVKNSQGALMDAQIQIFNYKKMQAAMKRLGQRHVRAAFNKWADYIADEQAAEAGKMNQPHVQAFLKRILSGAGSAWLHVWKHAGAMRRKRLADEEEMKKKAGNVGNLEAQLEKLRLSRMEEVLKRILNREISGAFSKWKAATYEAKAMANTDGLTEMQQRMKEMEAQLKAATRELEEERDKTSSLEEKRKKAEEKRLALEERAKLDMMSLEGSMQDRLNSMSDEVMKLKLQQSHFVVKKWMNRTYRHYFDEWVEMWEFNKYARRAISKMKNRGLSMAFSRWCEMVEEAIEMRVKIKRSLAKMMNRALSGSFDTWIEMVQEAKEMRVLLERCARKMMNKAMSGAWERWCEFTEESIEMKTKVKRALAKMMNRQMSQAFDRWAEMVEEAKEMRVLLARCAKKMMNRQLSSSWEKWYELIEEKRQAGKHEKILKKFMHRDMAKAWESWMELHDLFKVIRRATKRMMNKAIAGAWERWCEAVDEILEMRAIINKALKKMMNRAMSGAFDTW